MRWSRGARIGGAVVALAAAVLSTTGSDPEVRIDSGAALDAASTVSIDLPEGWQQLPLVSRLQPAEILAVGTTDRPAGDPIQGCLPVDGRPDHPAAFITLYEYQPDDPLTSPDGAVTYGPESFQPRPADFRADGDGGYSCPSPNAPLIPPSAPVPGTPEDGASSTTLPPVTIVLPVFTDHTVELAFTAGDQRRLLARIVSVEDPTSELLEQAYDVLNSLVITAEAVPTTTTTAIPGFDALAAEQQIVDAINASLGTPSPTPSELSIEGGHPFADPAAAEQAAETARRADGLTRESYEASQEGKLVATIHWIVFDSPTYARLRFDVLNDGELATATTTGYAVYEGGFWRLGRATFCEIARRGGVACQ